MKGYVYRHIRLDTNQVFYIGIGGFDKNDTSYKRAYDKTRRSNLWKNIINKTDYEVEIILEDLSFEKCCEKEIEFIKIYGRKDKKTGTLANMTDGGESGYGRICKEETKEKLRNRKVTDKMLVALDRTGKKHTIEAKENMSNNNKGFLKPKKSVIIEGILYNSIGEASRKLNIPKSSLIRKYRLGTI